jgi:hypothetical protein
MIGLCLLRCCRPGPDYLSPLLCLQYHPNTRTRTPIHFRRCGAMGQMPRVALLHHVFGIRSEIRKPTNGSFDERSPCGSVTSPLPSLWKAIRPRGRLIHNLAGDTPDQGGGALPILPPKSFVAKFRAWMAWVKRPGANERQARDSDSGTLFVWKY